MNFYISWARAILAPALSLLISAPAHAQSPPISSTSTSAAKALPPPCSAAENRQFDFWIGDWDVTTPNGKLVGTNLIKPILRSCVLDETWIADGGFTGKSYTSYDAPRKVWHHTFVDEAGHTLLLDGKFENGKMTMSDREVARKPDRNAINEITWTANLDGSVHQYWRASANGGKTWQLVFDGKYVKSNRPQPKR